MQKIATHDIWTSGIVNVPLNDKNSRYLFFELDTKNMKALREVINAYDDNDLTVYYHETISGYHFFSLTPITRERYGKIMRSIKHLNPNCPMTTLRIIPNKWINEREVWNKSTTHNSRHNDTLTLESRFGVWLEAGIIDLVSEKYQVVRYPLEECPRCKTSKDIVFHNGRFYCDNCNIQTVGRFNK